MVYVIKDSLEKVLQQFVQVHTLNKINLLVKKDYDGTKKYKCLNYGVSSNQMKGKGYKIVKSDYTLFDVTKYTCSDSPDHK